MTTDNAFEYARDDFNYPRFAQNLLKKMLNYAIALVQEKNLDAISLSRISYGVSALSIIAMLIKAYLLTAILLAGWLFIDQVRLHLFVDRSVPASRLKHLGEELPLIFGLVLHMWLEGHIWSGVAGLLGVSGLFLLTNLQMKYDLMAINIPRLYFLRWDRMGIIFLFTLLGSWPGERAYLFVVLLPWFLLSLTYYDYIWILIQLAKKKK